MPWSLYHGLEVKTTMITIEKYNCIKILLNSGADIKEVSTTFKLNENTVKMVKRSQSYDEYKQDFAGALAIKKAKTAQKPCPVTQIVEHRQSIEIQATHYMTTELKEIKELLKLMSNKLAFIVEKLS